MRIIKKLGYLLEIFVLLLNFSACSQDTGTGGSGSDTDKTPPSIASAVIYNNGKNKIILQFNEAVNIENPNGFSVDASVKAVVNLTGNVYGSGTTSITIELSRNIAEGETVTLSYDGTGSVRDLAGNILESFSSLTVTNNINNPTPPIMTNAVVQNAAPSNVVVTFSEQISSANPANGFTIRVGVSTAVINTVTGNNTVALTFTLNTAVIYGNVVTIEYNSTVGNIVNSDAIPLESFGPVAVTNNVLPFGDTTPPQFVSAEVQDSYPDRVTATFSENLSNQAQAGFTITIEGNPVTVDSISADSSYIIFYINTPAQNGDTITISYDDSPGTVTDTAGNPLATFGPVAVTNNVLPLGDTTPPQFVSAEVQNSYPDRVTATFSENLSNQAQAGFTITIEGTPVTVDSISADSEHITFYINTAAQYGDTITISYDDSPGTVTDTAGNPLATFGTVAVTNNVLPFGDTTPPQFVSAEIPDSFPFILGIQFSEPIYNASADGFTLEVNSSPVSLSYFMSIEDDFIVLEISQSVQADDEVTIYYDETEGAITDYSGNPLESFGPEEVIFFISAPELTNAIILDSSPDEVVSQFSESINVNDTSGFTITINGADAAIIGTATGSGADTITFTLSEEVAEGDDVTIAYDGTGNITDDSGNPVAAFDPVDVINCIGPPYFVSAEVQDGWEFEIMATFSEPLTNISEDGILVRVNGTIATINYIYNFMEEEMLDIYIDTPVQYNDSITLQYISASGTITDLVGNPLASFGPAAVTNNVELDTTPPAFVEAMVWEWDPYTVEIYFNDNLYNLSSSGFTVRVNGDIVAIDDFYSYSEYLDLHLANPVNAGAGVTVQYDAGPGTITDTAGNQLTSFGPELVTNYVTGPEFVNASVYDWAPAEVVATFSRNIILSDETGFTITINGSGADIIGTTSGSGSDVIFTLSNDVTEGEPVTIAYNGSGDARDYYDNPLEPFGPVSVYNYVGGSGTSPYLIDAYVDDSAPADVLAVFNEELQIFDATGFTITVHGSSAEIISTTSGSGSNIIFTLYNPVEEGDDVTIAYNGSGYILDYSGNQLEAFGPVNVANYVGLPTYTIETFPNGGSYGGYWADTYVYLYDSSYNLLAEDDDSGSAGGYSSRVVYTLVSGETYYIVAQDYYSSGDYYSLLVNIGGGGSSSVTPATNAGEPNNDFEHATGLTAGTVFNSCFSPAGESDFYVITIP